MKYLFLDIECADGGKGTICSFGCVIADESFKILRREDIIINPEGRFYLTGRAGRPDIELAYPIERFRLAPNFAYYYPRIKALVENEEYCVVGHSVGDDVTYLNKACARYGLVPLCFGFFDTQRMYREILGEKNQISLENAVRALLPTERFRAHQSVEDARATMLVLKALLEKKGVRFEAYRTSTDRCTGRAVDGRCVWDYTPPQSEGRRHRDHALQCEKGENVMLRGRKNHTLFLRYLDYGESIGEKSDKLKGMKVSVSMNYETEHFKEMILLAGMIKAAGGEYVLRASGANIFATVDVRNEDGTPRRCSRGEYVQKEIESGREIELITLDELLARLGTSRAWLEGAPLPDVEYLLDEKYKRSASA
ncbi:MAG: 3'-5' exonuclease [Clostridia bacterium]|nr:3'-5' exonuclease [Clostridia bacterium]